MCDEVALSSAWQGAYATSAFLDGKNRLGRWFSPVWHRFTSFILTDNGTKSPGCVNQTGVPTIKNRIKEPTACRVLLLSKGTVFHLLME